MVNRESRESKDGAKSSAVKLPMVRDNNLGEGIVVAKDDVASFLPPESKTGTLQGFYALTPGDPRQLAHTAITRTSKRSTGTGNPSSSRAAM